MPTASQYALPPTENASEFENMVTDYFRLKGYTAWRYGRSGQAQHGIDILANIGGEPGCIAIQCKNYYPGIGELDEIVKKTLNGIETLNILCSKIVIAIGKQRDTRIQNHVREKRDLRVQLELLFWEDIRDAIASSGELMARYYPGERREPEGKELLIDSFNRLIQECEIIEIMRDDPLAGMRRKYVDDMDIFCWEIEKELHKNILLQKDEIYQKIQEFSNWIGYYNQYLAIRMVPAGTSSLSVISVGLYEEMSEQIKDIKISIDECYRAINSECSIF